MLRALAQAHLRGLGDGFFFGGYERRGDPTSPCTGRDCVLTPASFSVPMSVQSRF